MSETRPRLYRSRRERMIGGVCGGLAQWLGWDPTLVRIAFVLSIVLPGPQVLAYLVMWVVVPVEPEPGDEAIDVG